MQKNKSIKNPNDDCHIDKRVGGVIFDMRVSHIHRTAKVGIEK